MKRLLSNVAYLAALLTLVVPIASAWKADDMERIIVRFKEGTPQWKKEIIHSQLEPQSRLHRDLPKLNLHVIKTPKGKAATLLAKYRNHEAVKFAEVDALVEPHAAPNDPRYPSQWHLPKIQCPIAWDVTTGSASVTVAVCDTGVDPNHVDLQSKLIAGYNSADGSSNTSDFYGHGTKCAGVIAAVTNNGTFVAGVSWNSKIMPIRITNSSDARAYFSDMAAGIQWAVDHGARVINLSYGSYSDGAISPTILSACRYAESKGAVVCISGGNDNTNPVGTQDPSEVVYVAGTDSSDKKASFSNYGAYIDVAAPAVSIYTTTRNNGAGAASGTSFAAPIVCGVFALMFSAQPALSAADAKVILFSTADDLGTMGEDIYFGAGRVNAARAVQAAANFTINQPPLVIIHEPQDGATFFAGEHINFFATASDPEDGDITHDITWTSNRDGKLSDDGSFTSTLSIGAHIITATATDSRGATSSCSITIYVMDPNVVAAPTDLTATANSRQVTLRWKDNSTNETGFSIERAIKPKGNASAVYSVVGTVGSNITTFTDTCPSANTYLYRVRAFNNTMASSYSNTVQLRIK